MEAWCPFLEQNRAPEKYWGTYTDGPFKGLLHTTETMSFTPHSDSYGGWHTNYPHGTIMLKDGKPKGYQHIPFNKAARGLRNLSGGVETNTDSIVQFEIVWFAGDAQNMPKVLLDFIGKVMRWVEAETGIQRHAVDGFHFYPPENHIQLGYEPWRLRGQAFDDFNGWMGHQHADEQVHGDPGKIDINYLLSVGVASEDEPLKYSEIVTIPPPDPTAHNRQLATLKGKLILLSQSTGAELRTQDGGIFTRALVQRTEYAGCLVLSFIGLDGNPAASGNVWVDVEYRP